ncbi:U6 snRNA-associated Sm-like protein LSm1 isoform X1 [Ciconia boyciana]|uniref:U6 snRNA-associated Sm-like protein LSm1 isoform X1 n=1 Tax=Ciconia boyciana TaxID=52775 RepID=UPI003B9E51F6
MAAARPAANRRPGRAGADQSAAAPRARPARLKRAAPRWAPPGGGEVPGRRRRHRRMAALPLGAARRHHELHARHSQPHPGHRQEAPGPAAGRPDAHRVPAQHRPVRKLGVAPDCGAHPRGQEVWGHPSGHLCCERRERCSAGGNRRAQAFTGPNPWAAFEPVSAALGRQTLPQLGCSPREPSCSNSFGKSDGALHLWCSHARSPREHRAWPGAHRKRSDVTEAQAREGRASVETRVQIRPRPLPSPLALGPSRPALPWPDLEKESDTPLQQVSIEEILEEQRVEQQAKQESEKLKVQALKERGLSVPRVDTLDEY